MNSNTMRSALYNQLCYAAAGALALHALLGCCGRHDHNCLGDSVSQGDVAGASHASASALAAFGSGDGSSPGVCPLGDSEHECRCGCVFVASRGPELIGSQQRPTGAPATDSPSLGRVEGPETSSGPTGFAANAAVKLHRLLRVWRV